MSQSFEKLFSAKITLNVTVAGALAVIGVALCLLYAYLPTQREVLTFSASVMAGVAAIYSGFYAAKTLKTISKQRTIDNSFKLIEKLNEMDFMSVLSFVDQKIKPNKIAPDQLYNEITKDDDLHTKLRSILNTLEGLSIAIQSEYADEPTLLMDSKTTVCFYWGTFKQYIIERRSRKYPTLYCELEKLATAWESGKLLSEHR